MSMFTTVSAAAAAKSLQSCPTLCDPIDGSPPGSPVPGILQARTLEWVAVSFSNEWKWNLKVKSLSRVRLWATPWTAAYQALPSIGFSRQKYWSGVPLPSPTTVSCQALFLQSSHTARALMPCFRFCPPVCLRVQLFLHIIREWKPVLKSYRTCSENNKPRSWPTSFIRNTEIEITTKFAYKSSINTKKLLKYLLSPLYSIFGFV